MLNTRQKKFVDEYIKSGNASKAARLAGYSADNSDVQGAKLLANEKIKREVKRRLDEIHEKNTATLKETLCGNGDNAGGTARRNGNIGRSWEGSANRKS